MVVCVCNYPIYTISSKIKSSYMLSSTSLSVLFDLSNCLGQPTEENAVKKNVN
jgi:hypothetical protein